MINILLDICGTGPCGKGE